MIFLVLWAVQTIRVYDDRGQWSASTIGLWQRACKCVLVNPITVTGITADEIKAGEWKISTSLLIIPGGADCVYHQQLSGEGNRQIRAYVEAGGKILGVCAGAYYCGKSISFKGDKQEFPIVEQRELGFFPGIPQGPLIPYVVDTRKGAAIFDISCNDGHYPSYYNGGCYFPYDTKISCEWIGRYPMSAGESKWAIVGMQIGKGYVIASGVHPEMCSAELSGDPDLYSTLESKEKLIGPYALLRVVFKKLGFICKNSVHNQEQRQVVCQDENNHTHVLASIPGVFTPQVAVGQKINAGDVIGIIESMKMVYSIKAPVDGIVIYIKEAGTVNAQDVFARIDLVGEPRQSA